MSNEDEITKTGSAEFKTVKAGCGIRFDPDTLDEDAGFDFSGAQKLISDLDLDLDSNSDSDSDSDKSADKEDK